jgi:anti-repressor protein
VTTQIQPFIFPATGQSVRTLLVDGEPQFVAADVTAILGYRMASDATRWLDEDEKGTHQLRTPGGLQTFSTVSEAGLYSLILRSQVLGAREFKRWVTHEVLPAIRRTGSYSLPREMTRLELIDMARESELARIDAENRAAGAELQAMELAPAARAWDELVEGHGDYDVAQAAQILDRDRAIKTGQRRLFDYMASIGWIYRKHGRWTPYQDQVNNGRLLLKPQKHRHPEDNQVVIIDAPQVRVTVKGLGELHKRLGGLSQLPALMSEELTAA